jgi:hypothetical protein
MMIINESQRSKDEMLHVNAAISNMRMHLQWVVSATLQQRSNAAGAGGSRTPGSTTANASASNATRGGGGGGGARPGVGAGVVGLGGFRRLSDSNRQDTKL